MVLKEVLLNQSEGLANDIRQFEALPIEQHNTGLHLESTHTVRGSMLMALQFYIEAKYSTEEWKKIIDKYSPNSTFQFHLSYRIEVLRNLVACTASHIETSFDSLMQEIGEYFVILNKNSNERNILSRLGPTVWDFLHTFDSIYEITSGKYNFCSFFLKRASNSINVRVKVGYKTIFLPWYVGLIRGVCNNYYNINPHIYLDNKYMDNGIYKSYITIIPSKKSELDRIMKPIPSRSSFDQYEYEHSLLSLKDFTKFFPYYVCIDSSMKLVHYGSKIKSIVKCTEVRQGVLLSDIFNVLKPILKNVTYRSIVKWLDMAFILSVKVNIECSDSLLLKGLFYKINVEQKECLLFVGSPRLFSIKSLIRRDVYLTDIPVFDKTRQYILTFETLNKSFAYNAHLEAYNAELGLLTSKVKNEREFCNQLLYNVIPKEIAETLSNGKQVVPILYKEATVMFVGILNFQYYCDILPPIQLAKLVNDVSLLYDIIIKKHKNILKIETAGDKYMLASGFPEKNLNHAADVINVAFNILNAAALVKVNDVPITITIGINSDEIVAGVIGKKLPRYCVFGNTVNTASRTETTGLPGVINITSNTYKFFTRNKSNMDKVICKERGRIRMKGIEKPILTYIVSEKLQIMHRNNEKLFSPIMRGSHFHHDESAFKILVSTPIPHDLFGILRIRSDSSIEQIEKILEELIIKYKLSSPLQVENRYKGRNSTPNMDYQF